jgi:hypothetical protein
VAAPSTALGGADQIADLKNHIRHTSAEAGSTSPFLPVGEILGWVFPPGSKGGTTAVIDLTDGLASQRNPICQACGYPYAGPGLCSWCSSVHVLTFEEMVRPATQLDDGPRSPTVELKRGS